MGETESAKFVCGVGVDNILGRERYTVGKLLLCVCPYHQSLINH